MPEIKRRCSNCIDASYFVDKDHNVYLLCAPKRTEYVLPGNQIRVTHTIVSRDDVCEHHLWWLPAGERAGT